MTATSPGALRLLFLLLVASLLGGCAEVKPWERGAHAHRCMQWHSQQSHGAMREHVLDIREAKPGVGGSAGSGCGCG